MPHPEIERFARAIDDDKALRDELWNITDPMQFVSLVVRRAAERGVVLVDGEVWEALNGGRVSWLTTQSQ